ncbi:MAG: c-type cytochrome domain-containing protein [Verrucomicrobiota bacterium]
MNPPVFTLCAILTLPTLSAFAATDPEGDRPLDLKKDLAYEHVIRPIFANYCYSCHGEESKKGKLQMHTPEAIMKGGSEGDTVIPGDLEGSNAWFRMTLPTDDDEFMPPEDEPQLNEEQTKLVAWWIEQGASFDKKISELTVPSDIQSILGNWQVIAVREPVEEEPEIDMPPAADAGVVDGIANSGVLIMPLAQDSTFLSANVLNVADSFGDAQVKQFSPTAQQLTWLNLARSKITDQGAAELAKLTTLTRLHLENTGLTDKALPHIGKLSNLEYLNLYGTKVTDAGLNNLTGLKNLKRLYVWQTGVTEAGAAKLEKAIPGLEVNLGWKAPPPAENKEEKPAEKKENAAPAPKKKPAPNAEKPKEPAKKPQPKGKGKAQPPAKKKPQEAAPKKSAPPKKKAPAEETPA